MAEEDLSPIMAFQHLNIPNIKKATQKIMRRIQKNRIVLDTLVINNFGLPGETTMKQMMATITSRVLKPFTMRCVHTIRDINPSDTPLTVRVTSTNYEILIIPAGPNRFSVKINLEAVLQKLQRLNRVLLKMHFWYSGESVIVGPVVPVVHTIHHKRLIKEKDFMLVVFHTPQPAPMLPYTVKTTRKR